MALSGMSTKQLNTRPLLVPKTHSITADYTLSMGKCDLDRSLKGSILECASRESGKKYAVKVLHHVPKSWRDVDVHWRACVSSSIVKIEDVYENALYRKKYLFVIMEYMEGGRLLSRFVQPLAEGQAAAIVERISVAVAHIHCMNIAHHSLKLEALLFKSNSLDSPLKLTDFSSARLVTSRKMLQTPCHVSPEGPRTEKHSKANDMQSLGHILYRLLGGAVLSPVAEQQIKLGRYTYPAAEWSHISAEAKSLINHLLSTNSYKRLSIEEMLEHRWITSKGKCLPSTALTSSCDLLEESRRRIETPEEMAPALLFISSVYISCPLASCWINAMFGISSR